MGDKVSIGESLINIASAHQTLGDLENAKGTFERSLHLFREIGHQFGEGLALHGLGATHRHLGNATLAHRFLNESLTLRQKLGDKRGACEDYLEIGKFYQTFPDFRPPAD